MTSHGSPAAPPASISVGEYIVRKYGCEDAQALVTAVTESIEHLRPWMPWIAQEPQSIVQREEQIALWANQWNANENFTMGIFLGDIVVGGTGLHQRGDVGTLEIGYWVHSNFLQRGIATSVARELTTIAFGFPEISTVNIAHDLANVPSGKIPEKLGYALINESPRQPEAPGEIGVMRRWEITRDAWSLMRQAQ